MRASHMEKTEFMALFGGVFEHSPWIASAVWDLGLTGRHDTATGLHQPFGGVIRQLGWEEKLALLRAHPELAMAVVGDGKLTESSEREQRGAGLDCCNSEEFSEFQKLNDSYRKKFDFPFIMAVKGCKRHHILESFRARLENTGDEEFQTAVEQVIRIGQFRIDRIFEEYG